MMTRESELAVYCHSINVTNICHNIITLSLSLKVLTCTDKSKMKIKTLLWVEIKIQDSLL